MSQSETHQYKAEVKKVLDIVTHSLYTNREIFVRELISNAADALEKIRHEQVAHPDVYDAGLPLEIEIDLNTTDHTLSITDTGVGMTREELIENLGTIAHSGSADFLQRLADAAKRDVNLIGQFGVGFYSVFMVAKRVRVQTRSFRSDAQGYEWSSDGTAYDLTPCEGLHRGTRITVELKEDAQEFEKEEVVQRIIKQYSNFVPFPIKLKGKAINTVQAIWTRNRKDITEREYNEFYRFVTGDLSDAFYRLHFSADAPLQINALLFAPKRNWERFGFTRLQPGVDLYCRKVLIEKRPEELLPEWLRFVRGVVDSEDLPLNISRESMQDTALMRKLSMVLTGRLVKMFAQEAEKDGDNYAEFYKEFGMFFKEGAVNDETHRDQIAPLLRFETSRSEAGKLASLKDYVSRMKEGQRAIYYINGPSREAIEAGPYLEIFRRRGIEVLYTFEPVDDFVLTRLGSFEEKEFISADAADLRLPAEETATQDAEAAGDRAAAGDSLSADEARSLCGWMKSTLGDRVTEVRESKRLDSSPAIAVNPDNLMTGAMKRVLQATTRDLGAMGTGATLEVNPRHALIKRLAQLRSCDELLARQIAEQILDNALIAAGLMVDPRPMIQRLNDLLTRAAGV